MSQIDLRCRALRASHRPREAADHTGSCPTRRCSRVEFKRWVTEHSSDTVDIAKTQVHGLTNNSGQVVIGSASMEMMGGVLCGCILPYAGRGCSCRVAPLRRARRVASRLREPLQPDRGGGGHTLGRDEVQAPRLPRPRPLRDRCHRRPPRQRRGGRRVERRAGALPRPVGAYPLLPGHEVPRVRRRWEHLATTATTATPTSASARPTSFPGARRPRPSARGSRPGTRAPTTTATASPSAATCNLRATPRTAAEAQPRAAVEKDRPSWAGVNWIMGSGKVPA